MIRQVPFTGVIFPVGRGSDGDGDEALFAANGNGCVFPIDGDDTRSGEATSSLDKLSNRFVWQRGSKAMPVQHGESEIDGRHGLPRPVRARE